MADLNYRDVLYRDYSTHFEKPVSAEDAAAFPIFETVYRRRPSTSSRVLDLACGRGSWLRWMKSLGYANLAGVDFSRHDLDAVNLDGCELTCGDLFDFLKNSPGGYGVIHAKDVIEHMTRNEVVAFLTLCRERLEPGGQLWISTFNALAPMAAQTWHGDFTHEIAFSPSSMKQAMRACGFPAVSVECAHPVPDTLRGKTRRLLLLPFTWAAQWNIWLRYGGEYPDCRPSLLALATKDDARS